MILEKIKTEYYMCRIPGIIATSRGSLVAYYECRKAPGDWAQIDLKIQKSTDGGESWQKDLRLYENTASDDIGYPSTVELPDGTLLTVFYAKETEEKPCVIMQQKWKLR